jgi:hypothetical protein
MVSSSCVPQKNDPEWVKDIGFMRFEAHPEMLVYAETEHNQRTISRLLYHFTKKYPTLVVALKKGNEMYVRTRRDDVEVPCVFGQNIEKLRAMIAKQIDERMDVEGWDESFLNTYYDSQFIQSRVNVKYAQTRMARYNLNRPVMKYVRKKLREARGIGNRKLTDYF